jgi:phage terminase small subunit
MNKKPTAVLQLTGAYKTHPERKRIDPETSSLGDPPSHLTECEKNAWEELVKSSPLEVLRGSDAQMLEICACLLADFRANRTTITPAKIAQLTRSLSTLGRTPIDRARLGIIPTNEEDENMEKWRKFANG